MMLAIFVQALFILIFDASELTLKYSACREGEPQPNSCKHSAYIKAIIRFLAKIIIISSAIFMLILLALCIKDRELMGNPAYGDHSSASSSSHVCPYLAMHGFPHAVHAAPSSSADSLPENGPFHRHPSSMGGQSSADMINSHGFPATEPQNPNWQQQHSFTLPLSGNNDQSASQFGLRLSRNDTSSQQRLGSFVHPHPLMHG